MSRRSQQVALIREVAISFGDLLPQFVFVGGSVAGLLITQPGGEDVRATDDVDVVVAITSPAKYTVLQEQLRAKNFKHVIEGPLCRFKIGDILVDVMPSEEKILGFNNQWYSTVMDTAEEVILDRLTVRVDSNPKG